MVLVHWQSSQVGAAHAASCHAELPDGSLPFLGWEPHTVMDRRSIPPDTHECWAQSKSIACFPDQSYMEGGDSKLGR